MGRGKVGGVALVVAGNEGFCLRVGVGVDEELELVSVDGGLGGVVALEGLEGGFDLLFGGGLDVKQVDEADEGAPGKLGLRVCVQLGCGDGGGGYVSENLGFGLGLESAVVEVGKLQLGLGGVFLGSVEFPIGFGGGLVEGLLVGAGAEGVEVGGGFLLDEGGEFGLGFLGWPGIEGVGMGEVHEAIERPARWWRHRRCAGARGGGLPGRLG